MYTEEQKKRLDQIEENITIGKKLISKHENGCMCEKCQSVILNMAAKEFYEKLIEGEKCSCSDCCE